MSGVIDPKLSRYIELVGQHPLSETITEMEELFDGDLRLSFKSAEHEVEDDRGNHAKGRVIGYKDKMDQTLFIYLGLVYVDNNYDRVYPQSFFFGTDIENGNLEEFLARIQSRNIPYTNRKNVLEKVVFRPDKNNETSDGLLITCINTFKRRKVGSYEDFCSLPFGSTIDEFKQVLDK